MSGMYRHYYWGRLGALMLIGVFFLCTREENPPNVSRFRIKPNSAATGSEKPIRVRRGTNYYGHSFLYDVAGCENEHVINFLKELEYDVVAGDKPDFRPEDMPVSSEGGPEDHFTIRNSWPFEDIVIEPDGKVTVRWPNSRINPAGDRSHESRVKMLCQRLYREG